MLLRRDGSPEAMDNNQISLLQNAHIYVIIAVYASNWATLFLGDINKGTWPSRLGESQMRE
jgi:hypothetical protein